MLQAVSSGQPIEVGKERYTIAFHCTPLLVDKEVSDFFNKAIQGQAHLHIHPNLACTHLDVAGPCGNLRGALSECRCEVLDRKTHPTLRQAYEDQVIQKVLDFAKAGIPSLKMAMFCPGRLLGEEILLFRLFHALNQLKRQPLQHLQLFLIDRCYKNAVLNQASEEYMTQFLREISQFLPSGMRLDVTFFYEADHYMALAESKGASFQHDLLIGQDIYSRKEDMEANNRLIADMARRAGRGDIKPIILTQVFTSEQTLAAKICKVNRSGLLTDCEDPIVTQTGSKTSLKTRNIEVIVGVSVGGLCLFGLIVFLIIYLSSKTKKISASHVLALYS